MKLLGPSPSSRLNEAVALFLLSGGVLLTLSLVSYQPQDPSWNTVAPAILRPQNLTGFIGSYVSDACFQALGLASIALPVFVVLLAWKWMRSQPIAEPLFRVLGAALFLLSACTALSIAPGWRTFSGSIPAGGLVGLLLADFLVSVLNFTGASIMTATLLLLSLYLVSSFSMATLIAAAMLPVRAARAAGRRLTVFRLPSLPRFSFRSAAKEKKPKRERVERASLPDPPSTYPENADAPPWDNDPPIVENSQRLVAAPPAPAVEDIPIRTLEELPPPPSDSSSPEPPISELPPPARKKEKAVKKQPAAFQLPPTELLNEPAGRSAYDSQELKDTAARIKAKFEEFNVLGSVVQINPGPVVTTFEYKPEAGIKYSRITTLHEDLCLGLQAESILIERIPGKPTVGIEVPNSKREIIALREILESGEFSGSAGRLPIALGKDVQGRIRVVNLETMPHLLVAGATGSGKSVMLNALIMSILVRSTPHEVRMIMIDPKRVELGIYEGVPHLLTPVIIDPRKATNALRNAVLEMERRLMLLAAQGVRNIEQYNKKVRQLAQQPRSLFEEEESNNPVGQDELKPLPFILLIIDELADLMMLERAGVEESVARLAQMARAVGIHLVLATQRPSVDVITGLIKANFPARVSFQTVSRVDSRTILDVMGAEHLLGKGDMLMLPPGSGRLQRVHGAFVTETEIHAVVDFWKQQARPEYDQSYLLAPPSEDGEPMDEDGGEEDPMYRDAVAVVCEMGKASTSTLQRRLRLGYGRAARILDQMQREGIIGPPDGSRPRDVLRRPDWLDAPGDEEIS